MRSWLIINMFVSNKIFKLLLDDLAKKCINYNTAILKVFVYITSFLSGYIVAIIMRKISLKTNLSVKSNIRNSLFQFILKHQTKFFYDNFAGTLNTKINDIVNGSIDIIETFPDLISNINIFILMTFSFLKFSRTLFIFVFIWFFCYAYIFIKISKRINKLSFEQSETESEYSGQVTDCINSISNVKSFSKEKFEKAKIKKINI